MSKTISLFCPPIRMRLQKADATAKLVARPASDADGPDAGPVVEIRALDWYEYQHTLGIDDAVQRMRAIVAAGLVSVEGRTEMVAEFLERPAPRAFEAVFDAIMAETGGN
jgi:hypothetical protein